MRVSVNFKAAFAEELKAEPRTVPYFGSLPEIDLPEAPILIRLPNPNKRQRPSPSMSSAHLPARLRSREERLGRLTAENWPRSRLMATRARSESADYVTKWKALREPPSSITQKRRHGAAYTTIAAAQLVSRACVPPRA